MTESSSCNYSEMLKNLQIILTGMGINVPVYVNRDFSTGSSFYKIGESKFGVIETSILKSGRDFEETLPVMDAAYFAMLDALCKIAVYGANPVAVFLSQGMPPTVRPEDLREINEGVKAALCDTGKAVSGGTVHASDSLKFTIAIYGETSHCELSKLNRKINEGMSLYISGYPGDTEAGKDIHMSGNSELSFSDELLKKKYLRPPNRTCHIDSLVTVYRPTQIMFLSNNLKSLIREIHTETGLILKNCKSLPVSDELSDFCLKNDIDPQKFTEEARGSYEIAFVSPLALEDNLRLLDNRINITRIGTLSRNV